MRVVCISDTHLRHDFEIPDGDILIHAGDATRSGAAQEVAAFAEWFGGQPHAVRVCIPGNHDFAAQDNEVEYRQILGLNGVDVLIHESRMLGGLKVFGSPWTPWFHDWAFNMPKGGGVVAATAARELWDAIPNDADIVITHGPPAGILDRVARGGMGVGCPFLAARIDRVCPKLHVFGHIHESYGRLNVGKTTYVNASILDLSYKIANAPQVLEF